MPAVVEAHRATLANDPGSMRGLQDHLVHEHGRSLFELGELPLAAVHELEHFDDGLGLLTLGHAHSA